MQNIEEEFEKTLQKADKSQLFKKVEEQLARMEHARKNLENSILLFQAACMDSGFKIAQIQYRMKHKTNVFEDEGWQKWDLTLEKQLKKQ